MNGDDDGLVFREGDEVPTSTPHIGIRCTRHDDGFHYTFWHNYPASRNVNAFDVEAGVLNAAVALLIDAGDETTAALVQQHAMNAMGKSRELDSLVVPAAGEGYAS